jgi:hypothetical protein
MKYNEPIRAKGIGRDQLAFPTGGIYSELLNDEDEFNSIAQDSTLHIAQEVTSQAIGLSKSSATAAASSAHKKAQNYPFGMYGVTSFAKSGTGENGSNTARIAFANVNVVNPNFFYDSKDQTIYVNEPGWYFVQCFFYSTSVQGANDWGLQIETNVSTTQYTEHYEPFFAYLNSSKHVTLQGSTIINLPNQDERLNTAGRYGFRIRLFTDIGFVSFSSGNTKASLNVFKLSELFEAERRFTINV